MPGMSGIYKRLLWRPPVGTPLLSVCSLLWGCNLLISIRVNQAAHGLKRRSAHQGAASTNAAVTRDPHTWRKQGNGARLTRRCDVRRFVLCQKVLESDTRETHGPVLGLLSQWYCRSTAPGLNICCLQGRHVMLVFHPPVWCQQNVMAYLSAVFNSLLRSYY